MDRKRRARCMQMMRWMLERSMIKMSSIKNRINTTQQMTNLRTTYSDRIHSIELKLIIFYI